MSRRPRMFMFTSNSGNPRIFTHGPRMNMFQGPIPELLGAFMGGVPPNINIRMKIDQTRRVDKRREAAKLLDVSEDANIEVIQKAYKLALKKWHPDRHPEEDKVMARKKFDDIVKAMEVLTQKVEVNMEEKRDDVFTSFANKVFEDFMRPPPSSEEEELDAEAEDLFDFLHGMTEPPGEADVYSFGPNGLNNVRNPEKQNLNFRVRIDLKDIWMNQQKKLPVKDRYLLNLPLCHGSIAYISSELNSYPFEEITVSLIDKPNPKFRRRGSSWDLETYYPIDIANISKDQILKIERLDGSELKIVWKGKDGSLLEDLPDKGFYLYDQGLPRPDGSRGKLWVKFALRLDGSAKEIDPIEDSVDNLTAELGTEEDWWNLPMEDRSTILDLNAYISVKP